MRDAHVFMGPSLRVPVELSQRRSVTEFRDNTDMPRPPTLPANLETIGQRVRWWRAYRRLSRKELATACGMAPSTLGDLENDITVQGKYLHLIAAELRLRPEYIQSGTGEPESDSPPEPPASPADDFPWMALGISKSEFARFDNIERTFFLAKAFEAVAEIKNKRKKDRKA